MIELLENRVLGAIRYVDGATLAPIARPLKTSGAGAQFTRNLSGLVVIRSVRGLERVSATFDLADLPPADEVPPGSVNVEIQVEDPSGDYLPRRFTLALPRDPSPLVAPDLSRPPQSLFTPIDIALLPAPAARLAPGTAEVRVLVLDVSGRPLRNALARVVATPGGQVLGCGMSDARGETLVAITGLRQFAPGATPEAIVTLETAARLEIVHPPSDVAAVDWETLRQRPAAPGDVDPRPLTLRPGARVSRSYPFPA